MAHFVVRIWLHEGTGNEPGWHAWSLDHMGFATWAATRPAVLERVPAKLREYHAWLLAHADTTCRLRGRPAAVDVVEHAAGDEVLFSADLEPASPGDIDTCLRLLSYSRSDLLGTARGLTDPLLDWDPPYADFASWASWRTIRQIMLHIADTEEYYYLPSIGCTSPIPYNDYETDWMKRLRESRSWTARQLRAIALGSDLSRVTRRGGEAWSLRKVLRRLVRHELLHWKSIKRIVRSYGLDTGYPAVPYGR